MMNTEIQKIETEIKEILSNREEILSFFLKTGKNNKENAPLVKNRKKMAELLLWDISEKIKKVSGTYLFKIEDGNISFSRISETLSEDLLSKIIGFPELYFILGNFELKENKINFSNDSNFYLEVPASIQMSGKLNPFLIEDILN